jgi:DNA invertase Pin-like site-specific DNA recombinase
MAQKAAEGPPKGRKVRCAVYTRKSSTEGLELEYNSIDAQWDSCVSYIAIQRAEGWILVPHRYDDGGVSGGTLDRPALKRLMWDIEHGLIDVIIVYKIDRLSRSLGDFLNLIKFCEEHGVTFVSVTQHFNTTTAPGRLMMNVLLSFAQFEREVIGERIRDKFAASRKRGMWMGGSPPLGYDIKARKLVINEEAAKIVIMMFTRFVDLGSATLLVRELTAAGILNRQGKRIDKSFIYRLLNNRVYLGEAVHKGQSYPGEHKAIVSQALWDRAHDALVESPRARAAKTRNQTPALLKGLIFGPSGAAMSPSHTRKNGRLYRYYVSQDALKRGDATSPLRRVPAGEIETAVIDQLRRVVRSPEIIVRTWKTARVEQPNITEAEVREALHSFDPLWDSLFPAEQVRIVQLLVDRVDVSLEGLDVHLRTEGLASLAGELRQTVGVLP